MIKLIEQVRHTQALMQLLSQRETLHLYINQPLAECLSGTPHNLWHPQVLPLLASVSAQSGYHPGE